MRFAGMQILVGLGLGLLCLFVPTEWIGDPRQAMFAGVITGMLAVDVMGAVFPDERGNK